MSARIHRYRATPTVTSGLHRLSGTTSIAGSPDVLVAARPVRLLSGWLDTRTLMQTISNAGGAWHFDAIAGRVPGDGYIVLAADPTGTYDPVAKAGLVPSPMPPDPAEHA